MTTELVSVSSPKDFDGKLQTLIRDIERHLPRSHAVKDDFAKISRVIHSIATYLYDRSRSPYSREDMEVMVDYFAMKLHYRKQSL